MTWLAQRDEDGTVSWAGGGGAPAGNLGRGTIVMDLDLSAFARARAPLVRLLPQLEPRRMFVVEPYSDGRLHLLRRKGRAVSHLSIGLGREPVSGRLRLSYHWDCARRRSLLTAENLTKGTIRQFETGDAIALGRDEIEALLASEHDCQRHPLLGWIGIADHWQTIGPVPGLMPAARVDTPDGPRRVAELRPGDLVETADHGPLPVLWQGRIMAPAMGSFRPVRLVAPYFGLERDLVVQPAQRIRLFGTDVEYNFAEDEVIAEARHLVNGETAIWEPTGGARPWHGLLFDRHALIRAEGVWTESLYLGRLARNADLAVATAPGALARRGALPVHSRPVRRELLEYEAKALGLSRLRSRSILAA